MTKEEFLGGYYIKILNSVTNLGLRNILTFETIEFHILTADNKLRINWLSMICAFESKLDKWVVTLDELNSVLVNANVTTHSMVFSDFALEHSSLSMSLNRKDGLFLCKFGNANDENDSFIMKTTINGLSINGYIAQYTTLAELLDFRNTHVGYLFKFLDLNILVRYDSTIWFGEGKHHYRMIGQLQPWATCMQKLLMG